MRRPLPGPARVVAAGTAILLGVLALAGYAGNRALALAGGSDAQARRAARLQPWSGEPWRVLGESQLARGEVAAARASFREGLERDDGDWELWLDLALAAEGAERARAIERARSLNPLDSDIAELAVE